MADSLYPAQIDDLVSFIPAEVQAAKTNKSLHMRKALSAASQVEITLGVNPQGGSADVATRLTAIEAQAALDGTVTQQSAAAVVSGSFAATAQLPYRGSAIVEVDFFFVQQGNINTGGPGLTFTAKRVYAAVGLGDGTYYAGNVGTVVSLTNLGSVVLAAASVDGSGLLSMPITWTNTGPVDCTALVRVKEFAPAG